MKHSPDFLELVETARKDVTEIGVSEIPQRLKDGARLIDVREDSEWDAGHAIGAVHIGRGVLERDIVQVVPEKSTELLLYCGGGYRSVLAAETLQNMGYSNVKSVIGGWKAWVSEGLPTGK